MNDTTYVDVDNSRLPDQREQMDIIAKNNHCPFCAENLVKYHPLPTLKLGKHWLVTENQWPYDHTKHHFLLITREHKVSPIELTPEAAAELIELTNWLITEYNIPGGGLAMRFGDSNYSAGSVTHLHAQLIQPDIEAEDYEPVRVKLGKYKEQIR